MNLEKGTFQEIDYQYDEAWIGGPGIPSYANSSGTLGFLSDNETIYFQKINLRKLTYRSNHETIESIANEPIHRCGFCHRSRLGGRGRRSP